MIQDKRLMPCSTEEILKGLLYKDFSGSIDDFVSWVSMEKHLRKDCITSSNNIKETIENILSSMEKEGLLSRKGAFFIPKLKKILFQQPIFLEFFVLNDNKYKPIPYTKYLVEKILKDIGASKEDIEDIIIGVVEAIENAVKYGTKDPIKVIIKIENNIFKIKIKNFKKDISHTKNIEKYLDITTLMRGMLAMTKVFDKIRIQDNPIKNFVTFAGFKKLKTA